MNSTETLAGALYESYCNAVGGTAFNGDPLPLWAEFYTDPKKAKQVAGWIAVARTVEFLMRLPK